MSDNTANISVADAVLASDSTAKRLTGDERRREILAAVSAVSAAPHQMLPLSVIHAPPIISGA